MDYQREHDLPTIEQLEKSMKCSEIESYVGWGFINLRRGGLYGMFGIIKNVQKDQDLFVEVEYEDGSFMQHQYGAFVKPDVGYDREWDSRADLGHLRIFPRLEIDDGLQAGT